MAINTLTRQWAETFRAGFAPAGPGWLDDLRAKAVESLESNGLPGRRDEDWKYTPMRALEAMSPSIRALENAPAGVEVALPDDDVLDRPDQVIDLFDGVFAGCRPLQRAGVAVLSLEQGLRAHESRLRALIEKVDLSGSAGAFAALNTAFLEQGLVIVVDENTDAGDVLLRWTFSGRHDAGLHNVRLFLLLGPGAKLRLAEQFIDNAEQGKALNVISHVELAEDAEFDHVRVQDEPDTTILISSTRVSQSARSRYGYAGFDLGGGLVRHQIAAELAGEGAHADFSGAFVLDGDRHVDNHVSVNHVARDCSSEQFFRGVLGGRSRGVFNGRALISPGADGSSVRQSNANLLLSDLAEMDTKPELEIYADEVEASHGATVGQLDEIAVFYLRSRGLSDADARSMLTGAFCRAVSDRLQDRALAENIARLIDRAMPSIQASPDQT
jgi:Fe-S cluster assembly protein SufD